MCLQGGMIFFQEKHRQLFIDMGNIKKHESMLYIVKEDNRIFTLNKRIVEFIIIGVQRAGTTSLSYNLSKHPDLYITSKSLNFNAFYQCQRMFCSF